MKKYITTLFTLVIILLIYSIIKNIEYLPHKYQIFTEEAFNFGKIFVCLWTAHTFIKYRAVSSYLVEGIKKQHLFLYWTARISMLPTILIGSIYLSIMALIHFYHVILGASCLTISDIQTNLSFHMAFILLILSVKMFALICFYTWIDNYGHTNICNISNPLTNK